MKIVLVGDCHAKVEQLLGITSTTMGRVIQLGDFGFGFRHVGELPEKIKFIRGNHDSPEAARKHPNYMGDYGYRDGIFFLSGAFSIDKQWRIPGVTWWECEELSYPELWDAVKLYEETKPKIVLTHEAPSSAGEFLLNSTGLRDYKMPCCQSRTSVALNRMLEIHAPEKWFFGHYHISKTFNLLGTQFQCLNELETTEIEI